MTAGSDPAAGPPRLGARDRPRADQPAALDLRLLACSSDSGKGALGSSCLAGKRMKGPCLGRAAEQTAPAEPRVGGHSQRVSDFTAAPTEVT